MNVKELIAHLSGFDPNATVTVNIPQDIAVPDGEVLHLNVTAADSFAQGEPSSPVVLTLGDTAYSEWVSPQSIHRKYFAEKVR